MDFKSITAIANQLEIKESELLSILVILNTHPIIETKELIRLSGLPETNLKRLLKSLDWLFEPATQNVVVKSELINQLDNYLKQTNFETENSADANKIIQTLEKYLSLRPKAKREYDQFLATLDTTINRALLLKKEGELYKQNILFLGDDDLTSIACALIATDCHFWVVDIDQEILNFIAKISAENHLTINTYKLDLKIELPKELQNKFDLVFTDPPYTPNGISLFLNRAIESLHQKPTSRIYLCFGSSDRAREREVSIQNIISQKNLLIENKLNKFNHYTGAESIGSASSLYTLSLTPSTKTKTVDTKNIYTNE